MGANNFCPFFFITPIYFSFLVLFSWFLFFTLCNLSNLCTLGTLGHLGPHFLIRFRPPYHFLAWKLVFWAPISAKRMHITAKYSHTLCCCAIFHFDGTKILQNLTSGSQFRKAPKHNHKKLHRRNTSFCITPHPPDPKRNFAVGNLDKRIV